MQRRLTKTNTIPGELHQIEAYVESLNTRIENLSEQIDTTSLPQIAEIRLGLKSASLGLERLQASLHSPVLAGLITDVGSAQARLRELQEQLWEAGRLVSSVPRKSEEARKSKEGRAASGVARERERLSQLVMERDTQRPRFVPRCENVRSEYFMTGALPVGTGPVDDSSSSYRDAPTISSEDEREMEEEEEGEEMEEMKEDEDATDNLPNGIGDTPVVNGHCAHSAANGYRSHRTTMEPSSTVYSSNTGRLRKEVHFAPERFLEEEPKPRALVLARLLVEQYSDSPRLQDPDKIRQGSTSGTVCTADIMTGVEDYRCVRPELAFLKLHEIRSLKQWLTEHQYLRRIGTISRIEKLLHLIFALQDGCRFEKIAVWFSRSPRQVYDGCREAFNGLLELHSETMLPHSDKHPVYRRMWKITDSYATAAMMRRADLYYPWRGADLRKVIVALNFYIGRYRRQGHEALTGPLMQWGRYLEVDGMKDDDDDDEDSSEEGSREEEYDEEYDEDYEEEDGFGDETP